MTYTDIRQRAIDLIQQLPPERLGEAVRWLESLNHSDEETALIEIIQRRLPPDDQQRFEQLRDRSECGTLSESERQEFIAYADRIEQQNVERLQALMKLAKIKNVDLPTLNQQFRSENSSPYAL